MIKKSILQEGITTFNMHEHRTVKICEASTDKNINKKIHESMLLLATSNPLCWGWIALASRKLVRM